MPEPIDANNAPLWKRIAWMAGIWFVSVASLGAVTLLLRLWLKQ